MQTIAEFLAMVGFEADKASMNAALKAVAGFGAAVGAAASAAIAGLLRIAQGEAQLADDAQKLSIPCQKLEELRFVAEQTGVSAEALSSSLQGLKKANPGIKDTGLLLEQAAKKMQGMSEAAAEAYAGKMGIDPALIPMLRQDVAGLAEDYRELYRASGRNAGEAAAAGKAVMQEFARLRSIADLVVKSVAGAFLGRIRSSMELLRKTVAENFHKIKFALEAVIGVVLRAGNVLAAFVYRIIKFAGSIIDWFARLDASHKKLLVGIGLLAAAWKLLNKGFLATPIGMVVAALTTLFLLIDDYLTWADGGDAMLDWSKHAETIEKVIGALKVLWNVACAVFAGIAKAVYPVNEASRELLSVVLNTVSGIINLFAKLFSGDLSGAAQSCKAIFNTLAEGVIAIFRNLVNAIAAFFGGMWQSVTESFPDFAAWAKKSCESIKNFFGGALNWVKEKLQALTGFLPDWIKKKIGMGNLQDTARAEEQGQNPAQSRADQSLPVHIRPVPQGPLLKPGPMQTEQTINKNTEIRVDSKTEITVNGTQNPEAVAGKVSGAQQGAAADIARNMQGAVR